MLIEQIIVWMEGVGSLGRTYKFTPTTAYFHEKNENLRVDYYLLLKYCRRQCTLLPSTWAKSFIKFTEVGTNNIVSKAQRSFQPGKAQRKMRNLIFLLSEAQCNFRNELFDSVKAQRNSAIVERYFRTKLKRNLTSTIEISQLMQTLRLLQF